MQKAYASTETFAGLFIVWEMAPKCCTMSLLALCLPLSCLFKGSYTGFHYRLFSLSLAGMHSSHKAPRSLLIKLKAEIQHSPSNNRRKRMDILLCRVPFNLWATSRLWSGCHMPWRLSQTLRPCHLKNEQQPSVVKIPDSVAWIQMTPLPFNGPAILT